MSNEIRSFLSQQDVLLHADCSCKRAVLRLLASHVAKTGGVDEQVLLDALMEREQLGSTGVGRGVALPHGRANVNALRGVFVRLKDPVDFDAIDGEPVDLVFMLLAPTQANGEHLKALSRIARVMRSDETRLSLRGATSAETIYAIVTEEAGAAAA